MFKKIQKILRNTFISASSYIFTVLTILLIVNNEQWKYFDKRKPKQKRKRALSKTIFIMPPRNNILLRKLAQLKQVRLPNGRTLLARYKRVNRGTLTPTKVRIRRTYTRSIGPRRQRRHRQRLPQQQGTGIENKIIKGINIGKKAANTEIGCMIVDDTIGLIPKAYKKLKNKLFKRKKKSHKAQQPPKQTQISASKETIL